MAFVETGDWLGVGVVGVVWGGGGGGGGGMGGGLVEICGTTSAIQILLCNRTTAQYEAEQNLIFPKKLGLLDLSIYSSLWI